MAPTLLLAKVIGVFLVIAGIGVVLRRHELLPALETYARATLLRVTISSIELLAGLFLLVQHHAVAPLPAAVITFIGVMLVVEGALFLVLSDNAAQALIALFNKPAFYLAGGILAALLGAWLALSGFGVV